MVGENSWKHKDWNAIRFRRPEDFIKGEVKVFEGEIEPGDCKQGSLGNCYFISTIAALAEWPRNF